MSDSVGGRGYKQFADRYAEIAEDKVHNAHLERPATRSLLPDVFGLRVLDAGCGPGFNTLHLLDHGAVVVALDVTPRFIEIARERVRQRAAFHLHDLAQPMPFAQDGEFDLILSALVLDYIADWDAVAREFARVLKPNGLLVFSCQNPVADWDFAREEDSDGGGEDYFAVEYSEMYWQGFGDPAPLVGGYRRSISAQMHPFMAAGFVLDAIVEPQPTEGFKQRDVARYHRYMKEPLFIAYRWRKN